jgi:aspartate beta-hydroxylase
MTSVVEARDLFQQGRYAEAERAFERVLEHSPNELQALNVVGMAALRSGQVARALALLEHAAGIFPQDAVTWHHLGRAQHASGNENAATEAFRTAVRLSPEFHLARLHLAQALQRSGDARGALVQYARALRDAQKQGRWVDAASTPAGLRPLVEQAALFVRHEQHALFEDLFDPIAARYGRDSMRRVETALRVLLKEEKAVPADPRQSPSFLFFPGLPTAPYVDRSVFPWIEALEARTEAIRAELHALLASERGPERVFTSTELEKQNLRGLDTAPSWRGYYFWRHGEPREDNCAQCPTTCTALDGLPLSRIRGHGPEVLFSVFTPGTHLLPHRGVTNTRLVAHLPLVVPDNCALSVGGEIHEWRPGNVVVFDDTYEHEAWNRSARTRVVLIFDVWNPWLIEAERAAITALVEAWGDLRTSVEEA